MEYTDCCFMFDNEALYDICTRSLNVENPSYESINRLIAQVESLIAKPVSSFVKAIASTTASLRFNGDLDIDLHEVKRGLVPMPRLHFPIISYAPFLSRERAGHKSYSVQELTNACFNRENLMIKCETDSQNSLFHRNYRKVRKPVPFRDNESYINKNNELVYARNRYKEKAEQYISCCLLYRGDVAPTNVHSSIENIKKNKQGYITNMILYKSYR